MKVYNLESFFIINKIKEHKKIKPIILNLINELPNKKWENVTNTDWEIPKENKRDYLIYFYKNIESYMNRISFFMKASKWIIHNGWYHQYSKNSFYDWHSHGGTNFANIYFLEMPKKEMKTKLYNVHTKKLIDINVKEGDLLTFPAYIAHKSDPIKSNSRKTVISFNCCFDHIKIT